MRYFSHLLFVVNLDESKFIVLSVSNSFGVKLIALSIKFIERGLLTPGSGEAKNLWKNHSLVEGIAKLAEK